MVESLSEDNLLNLNIGAAKSFGRKATVLARANADFSIFQRELVMIVKLNYRLYIFKSIFRGIYIYIIHKIAVDELLKIALGRLL